MDDKQPYIRQKTEDEELYSRLQRQTLTEVQRLSGKVWTDFNVHDPGVTLADIADYALTELDYKLNFPLSDYLTAEDSTFDPKRFGLFPPDEVYTTAPVTIEDYRKLFFSYIPELENVWMECDKKTGGYIIKVLLSPFEEENKDVAKQIKAIYNSHRNLCEYLEDVNVVHPEKLDFHAEFEIEPGNDASVILARIYWTILCYLSGGVDLSIPEDQPTSGLSLEQWLEGSENALRVVIPEQQNTEYELYKKLTAIKGICSFSTCYLQKGLNPLTCFSDGYSLKIPRQEDEMRNIRIRCGRSLIEVDMEKFTEQLKAFYYTKGRIRTKKTGKKEYDWGSPEGTYRDIFPHYPIAREFPACYGLSTDKVPSTSFEAYLKLYDRIIENGLREVKELPRLLSILEKDMDYPSARNLYASKSCYLDFLDRLYGVESQPVWMEESDCYGETEEDILRRRTDFLRHVARLLKNRARARDITDENGGDNIPVAKEWFCRLLGINWDESRSVGNVLATHNLVLMRTEGRGQRFRGRLAAKLITEKILDDNSVEAVWRVELPDDEDEKIEQYEMMRRELPVFNHNFISSGLFRGGVLLNNYRLVHAADHGYMLVFNNLEEKYCMNLGRIGKKEHLNLLANILCRYLLELNRECETLYIVEPVLSDTENPFTLSIVLPSWSARFRSARFREVCQELLRSLIPAHLKMDIYWLGISSMQEFEDYYRLWRMALARKYADDAQMLLESMNKCIKKNKRKTKADDND
nr:hypothetical protein [Parabacteroides goldsteinii]